MDNADRARVALGALRLVYGATGLVAPQLLAGRVDPARPPSPAAIYAFRLFGVRTVLIGGELLAEPGTVRRRALDQAPLVHAADTVTAALLTARGQVPLRRGLPLVAVSATNTGLAMVARRRAAVR